MSAPTPPHGKIHRFAKICLLPAAIITWLILTFYAYISSLIYQLAAGSDGNGHPFGDCFINFWSAAKLASMGRVSDIYNWEIFHVFEQDTVHANLLYYHYSYPPLMPLLTQPLAWLSYTPAFFTWMAVTWALFYIALRAARPPLSALFISIAIPAFLSNLSAGQNGMLTAALLGGGLILLPKRPILAGILFGLLCFKPQIAFLVPVALIAGKQWRTLATAAATCAILVALSIVAYGPDLWLHYLQTTSMLRAHVLENNDSHSWQQFVSVFISAREFGAGIVTSYVIQAIAASLALFVTIKLWKEDAPYELRCATLIIATFLATPYAMDYDLVVTAFAAIWLSRSTRNYQIPVILMLIAPIVSRTIGIYYGIGIGPFMLLPVFILAWRKSYCPHQASSTLP